MPMRSGAEVDGTGAVAFTDREFRNALGAFATGVTVVTAIAEDGVPCGMTANSFTALSLQPPLVLWSIARGSPSAPTFLAAEHFAISVLAADQIDISRRFSRPHADKFATVATLPGLGGVPLIDGAVTHFECRQEQRYEGGDHIIIIGRVLRLTVNPVPSLVFCSGRYQRGVDLEPAPDSDTELSVSWSGLA
jgi:flavin reductase (DIM6/NTAB) family NADH-FMN oxidoreductase RutF